MFVLQGGESILSEDFRAFWSVIPATVLDDMSIPANAKILYGVLSSLMRREGYCWPSNAQLAEAMHCSEDVVKRWVSALAEAGHIRVRIEPNRKVGGKITISRQCWQSRLFLPRLMGTGTNVPVRTGINFPG